MPSALPTIAFDPTKTVIPKKTFLNLTPTGGTLVSIVGKISDLTDKLDTVTREVPDADGYLRPDREVGKSRQQQIKFEVEDIKSLAGAFGTAATTIEGKLMTGTAELFVVDPDDATGKVALHSNIFKATWKIDSGYSAKQSEVTKATILVNSLEKVTLTPDDTVT